MATIPHYTCAACGHEWIPRAQKPPKICPKCKSDTWDKYDEAIVYFVRRGDNGPIKIGITTSVYARLNQIRTHSDEPIVLLAAISGGRNKEIEIANKFKDLKLSGEWYSPDETLINYINSIDDKIVVEPRKRGRPHQHGDAIAFRLPLKDDAWFRREANRRGMSPGDLAKEIALDSLKE